MLLDFGMLLLLSRMDFEFFSYSALYVEMGSGYRLDNGMEDMVERLVLASWNLFWIFSLAGF